MRTVKLINVRQVYQRVSGLEFKWHDEFITGGKDLSVCIPETNDDTATLNQTCA